MKLTFVTLVSILFIGCLSSSRDNVGILTKIDSIKPEVRIEDQKCAYHVKGYFKKYGYTISNFYEEVDYDFIDLDKDKLMDTLSILSPKNMLLPSENTVCQYEKKSNRLLLIKLRSKSFLFSNVIRNEFGIGTIGSESIEKTNEGFKLSYHKGQSCFFDYDINIAYHENNFFIESIKLRSGCPGNKEIVQEIKYSKREFSIIDYKRAIMDSLENLAMSSSH